MADKTRRLVYSTDPDPEPARPEAKPSANLAAALPTRQLNTPVRVWLDRKGRGGKTVSVIKTKLGTGGAIKDGDIEIQGDHREKIVVLLNELGYKAKSAGG
jgi:translation initiation factor 1